MKGSRPVDPRTKAPLGPFAQPGYYPGYHTLSQQKFWDEATRRVVVTRVETVPPIRFFSADEAAVLEAIADRLVPQDDRDDAHRIPIAPVIDEKLYRDSGPGYRFENMPNDRDAFRLGLATVDRMAHATFGNRFVELTPREQEIILKSLHDNKPLGSPEWWERMPAHQFFMLVLQDCAEAYYAHPWAWDEIGFGGPAYPRAYIRLEHGEPEPWEVDEVRYAWEPPPDSISGAYEPVGDAEEHYASPGRGGTH